MFGTTVFDRAADGFTVFYYTANSGFTSPTWQGNPSAIIEVSTAFITWLAQNSLTLSSAADSDADGDGVSLLMAYALGLDPNLNLSAAVPAAVFTDGATPTLSITFYSGTPGITYAVETSDDLLTWTTVGTLVSAPDTNGMRTATYTVGGTDERRFMRLVVTP